jgi:replication factor C small subunit
MTQLWTEKYRPQNINDYVWRDESQKAMAEKWIKDGVLPSILLAGTAGIGKTSAARMLLNELQVDSGDILEINASKERKVDDIQDKVLNFVSTFPLGDFKYVILDECLHEDEKILLSTGESIALKDMLDFTKYNVKSINMETGLVEDDEAMIISRKEDELFEVELDDGRTVIATADHPFLVENENGDIVEKLLKDLSTDDRVITVNEKPI